MSAIALGAICRTTSGGTPSRKRTEFFDGAIPWVKSGELTDGLVSEVDEFITDEAVASSSAKVFPAGTLLIALYGATVGKLGILQRAAATNQAVCAIFPPSDLDTKFLFWNLRHRRADLIAQAVGGAQPNISQTILRNLEIQVPTLDTQREVVAEIEKQFSRLDEAVAGLKRVKANIKRYKAAILKAAVEGHLVPTEADITRREGRNYETGAQLLQRILVTRCSQWQGKGKYKEPAAPDITDLRELPEGWASSNGAQLFRWSSGVNLPVKSLVGGPIPVYGGNGVNGGHSEANVSHETVVIGRVGAGCGNVHLVDRPAWITDNAIYSTWTPTDCSLPYLASAFSAANLNAVAAGSGQPFVNQTILNDMFVPLPPVAEQHRIVAELDRLLSIAREAEAEVETNLKRAQALRQAILSAAFSNRNAIT